MILYHYRAVDGTDVPDVHEGDLASLFRQHRGSVTPVVRFVAVTNANRGKLRSELLRRLPGTTGGLEYSIRYCIKTLSKGAK